MSEGPDVVCVGESMILVVPGEGQRLADARSAALTVAGAESTVALYLADLGHRTGWLSRVGADPLGEHVLAEIGGGGVDVGLVVRDPEAPTGVYFKDPAPEASGVYYYRSGSAASRLSTADLDRLDLRSTRLVHLSGVTPALSDSAAELATTLLARAGAQGVLRSFDVNHRPALWSATEAAPVLLELARASDVVFVGLDEAEAVWGTGTPEETAALIGGSAAVVVKDSDVGATLVERGRSVFVPAEPVDVVEPVGAGDAFAAGYLSGLLRGATPEARLLLGHRVAGFALRSMNDHADATSLRPAVLS
ncbi:sugar kinase [Pseudonocardia spinosispora]|uniref:sugar kinase n=1 Tax=Pseudonocardia spinosispora TaxID=103441 RepID=UPI000418221E|nr:sugar kinase [Pseudonocardia spinosispora]